MPPLAGLQQETTLVNLYGIQGEPSSGKTHAALSFPNPIVLDFDRKLPALNPWTNKPVPNIPFWDAAFIHKIMGTSPPTWCNRRDALLRWLRVEGPKIPADYTLIIDSWTRIQNNFDLHAEEPLNQIPYKTKEGDYDKFKFYGHKVIYSTQVMEAFKALSCLVVITFHEQAARDDKGRLTGKYKPLQDGQFKDQLAGHMAVLMRQVNPDRLTYLWQVRSNAFFSCMMPPIYNFPETLQTKTTKDAIPANWNELQKYRVNSI